jgi:hypothetical protein
MRDFEFVLSLASGFAPPDNAACERVHEAEPALTAGAPRAPEVLRLAPTAQSRLPAAQPLH